MNVLCHSPSGKIKSILKSPPSQRVLAFPGIAHSQFFRSRPPCGARLGFATKPNGWSRRHCFLGNPWMLVRGRARRRGMRRIVESAGKIYAYRSSWRRFWHNDISGSVQRMSSWDGLTGGGWKIQAAKGCNLAESRVYLPMAGWRVGLKRGRKR